MKSCGLYIHIPFCLQKCNYCDFISYPYSKELVEDYLLALSAETQMLAEKFGQPLVETIYLGGGTPTCLSGQALGQIIDDIYNNFPITKDVEISCEVNPGTSSKLDLTLLKKAGVNRLSIGVQSFNDEKLDYLGRIHDRQQIYTTYATAREVGFNNLNLDLIFAIPDQTVSDWQDSLEAALSLKPEHLSLYNLKLEEGTPFYEDYLQGRLQPVREEIDLLMYKKAISLLQRSGYEHYEISNFARPGFSSRHNLRYWHYRPFLALGPGAHGFAGKLRYANTVHLEKYQSLIKSRALPWEEVLHLTQKDLMAEFLIMGLRVLEGISLLEFRKRFDLCLMAVYKTPVEKLLDLGLVKLADERLALTERGIFLGNEVFVEFLL